LSGELTFVLGGARSGKSLHAEGLVAASGLNRVYIATAQAFDDEMRRRIEIHVQRRDARWRTLDAPVALAAAIGAECQPGQMVLVDCLTLWLTNILLGEHDIARECAALENAVAARKGPLVLVSNEVGLGIVPDNALARAFRDHAGRLHQKMAKLADRVHFIAAGLPLVLKG
jgi:adenosylcobinamide kinase / adenosylcobinamide-phosphate guanylyltransferase